MGIKTKTKQNKRHSGGYILIDPLQRKCKCGHTWHFNKLDYIRMILFNKIVINCPVCHRKHYYRLVYHAVEEHDLTREFNKDLEFKQKKLWKKG